MERAKAAAHEFLHKSNHHDTTVTEKINPAVVHETVKEIRNVEEQKVVDREIHQHHYHTSVQPVVAREVAPERHEAKVLGVEHREVHHGDEREVKARLEQEAAKFASTRQHAGVQETLSSAGTIVGEHRHHHVHETIQPVVQKEIIQPHVIHTTVPVHEVHHEAPTHHATSALPAVSLEEFKRQGGTLAGRGELHDSFAGEPKGIHPNLGPSTTAATLESQIHGPGHHNTTTTGIGHHGTTGTGLTGTTGLGHHNTTGTGVTGGTGLGHHNTTSTVGHDAHDTTGKKPSLLDRLNPLKDTDHDGKRGVME